MLGLDGCQGGRQAADRRIILLRLVLRAKLVGDHSQGAGESRPLGIEVVDLPQPDQRRVELAFPGQRLGLLEEKTLQRRLQSRHLGILFLEEGEIVVGLVELAGLDQLVGLAQDHLLEQLNLDNRFPWDLELLFGPVQQPQLELLFGGRPLGCLAVGQVQRPHLEHGVVVVLVQRDLVVGIELIERLRGRRPPHGRQPGRKADGQGQGNAKWKARVSHGLAMLKLFAAHGTRPTDART